MSLVNVRPLPLDTNQPTTISAPIITTNPHHSACPWPHMLPLMLLHFPPRMTSSNHVKGGIPSTSKLWPLISQHFHNISLSFPEYETLYYVLK